MITTAQIKWIKSLHHKKFRREYGVFLVEGDKIVRELLKSTWDITHVLGVEDWISNLPVRQGTGFVIVTNKELKRISTLSSPNKGMAVVKIPKKDIGSINLSGHITLMLDHIQDPGNLGTIIRTADWFGVQNIICSENTAELYNPKVIQSTMGSFMRVNLFYTNLLDYLKKMKEKVPVYGTLLEGANINKSISDPQGIIITGNESKGINAGLIPFITHKIAIPSMKSNPGISSPDSLNAAVATGIVLYHFCSQKASHSF
ncbi:MAG: TrmH family RNA methyltransferase [Bacteroidota bacterium]